jgi:hypothetical protein
MKFVLYSFSAITILLFILRYINSLKRATLLIYYLINAPRYAEFFSSYSLLTHGFEIRVWKEEIDHTPDF